MRAGCVAHVTVGALASGRMGALSRLFFFFFLSPSESALR